MKRKLITILMFCVFALGLFADTTSIINVELTVAKISPTYSLEGSIDYGKNTGAETATTKTTVGPITVNEGANGTLRAENIRLTNNTDTSKDDKQFNLTVVLKQNEARWSDDVNVTFAFSKFTYSDETTKSGETLGGTYTTDYPTEVIATKRADTIALSVGDLSALTNGKCSMTLNYSIFGYFIPSGTTIVTLKAVYDVPSFDNTKLDGEGYFPYGNYKGSVTVTISSR